MGPVHDKARLQLDKKTAKLKNSLISLKANNFKVRKTIRYHLKLCKGFIITDAYIGGQNDLSLLNFSCGYEKNK